MSLASEVSSYWPVSLEELASLLLLLLVVWVLRRLRSNGNGQGLPYLSRLVSQLNKDFGILVETIDDLFQDSSRLVVENSALRVAAQDLQRLLHQKRNVEEEGADLGDDDGEPEGDFEA